MHDLIVIGGGPAGLTAAVYAARKRMAVLLVTIDIGGQAALSSAIENYMGYQFITGMELVQKFEEQVRQFDVAQEFDEVVRLEKREGHFLVGTKEGKEFTGRAVVVAAGKRPRKLGVPGEDRLLGRGVSYCATCDGPLFAGMDVAVVGGGDAALQAAVELSKIGRQVYLVSRGPWRAEAIWVEKARATENIEAVIGYETQEITGEKEVERFVVRARETGEVRTLPVKGVFVEIGSIPNTDFVRHLVELNDQGEIVVNVCCETAVPGLFAAGDITNVCEKQVIVAAGEGAKATLSAFEYVMRHT